MKRNIQNIKYLCEFIQAGRVVKVQSCIVRSNVWKVRISCPGSEIVIVIVRVIVIVIVFNLMRVQ